jgi:predicted transcriptional regulator
MKAISLNVSETSYRKFQEIAERQGLPVSELIRRAMDEYLDRQYRPRGSVRDLPAFETGGILRHWKGADLYDEMARR